MFYKVLSLCVGGILFLSSVLYAGDLADGISNYTDDPISQADALGSIEPNVEYIILDAKSRASANPEENTVSAEDSTGNINSVILGSGAVVYGDITIIDRSLGNKVLTIGSSVLDGSISQIP